MSAEKLKPNPTSELLKNPVSILKKINNFLEGSPSVSSETKLRKWIQKEWKGINEELMQSPEEKHKSNDGEPILKQIIPGISESDGNSRRLIEYCSKFESFTGIDRLRVLMAFESWAYSENQYHMHIEFFADNSNRDNLLGLKIEYRELKRDGDKFGIFKGPTQNLEVKVSPSIEIHKI